MNRNAFVLTVMFHWSVMTIESAGLSLNLAIRSASWLLVAFALAAIISIRNCQISSSLTSITRRRLSRRSWITNPRQSVRQMKRPCAAGRPSFYRWPRISRPCCAVVRNVHILCLVHLCWSSSAKQNAAGHLLSLKQSAALLSCRCPPVYNQRNYEIGGIKKPRCKNITPCNAAAK